MRAAIVELKDAVRLAPHLRARPLSAGARAPPPARRRRDARAHFAEAQTARPLDRDPVSRSSSRPAGRRWAPSACSGCARRSRPATRPSQDAPPLGFAFTNVAREAGLSAVTVFGGERSNRYLLETTGCGVALFDYDNDGRLDIFIVNGTTLEGFPKGQAPTSHLYRNKGDGTFEDVTAKAGVGAQRLGPGGRRRRLRQRRRQRPVRDVLRPESAVSQRRRRHVHRRHRAAPASPRPARAGAPAPPSSTTTATADSISSSPTTSTSISPRRPRPIPACAATRASRSRAVRPGLPGGKNALYRNKGDGTFEDVSERAGILKAAGTYGLGVSTLDFDDDGWTDVYVANDSNPSALYRNNRDGTFTDVGVRAGCAYSQDGKPQAGMGVGIGDYDRNGTLRHRQDELRRRHDDAVRQPRRRLLRGPDVRQRPRRSTRAGSAGAPASSISTTTAGSTSSSPTATSIPRSSQLKTEAAYKQRKVVYRNLGTGRFVDVTERLGPPASTPTAGRGAAFGDLDNDGDIDIVVNNVHDRPDVFRTESRNEHRWLTRAAGGHDVEPQRHRRARPRDRRRSSRSSTRCAAAAATCHRTICACTSGWAPTPEPVRVEVRWPNGSEERFEGVDGESDRSR